jgi:integrase
MAKIRKRGNTYQIDYFDPSGKRVRQSFKKRKDAEAELGKRVSLKAENRYLDVRRDYTTPLGELTAKYQENYGHQTSFTSWKRYVLRDFEAHFGKDTLLSKIQYVGIVTYLNGRKHTITKNKRLRKTSTMNREVSCLHHLFSEGVSWDMLEKSPFDKGKTLLTKENNKRVRYLEEGEIQRLLAECPKHLRSVVVCGINTGLRRGEILRMKWRDIDTMAAQIYIGKTKTDEPRYVPINDDLAELLKAIRLEQGPGAEHVFTFANGEHHLKGKDPVRERKGPAPVPEAIKNPKTAFNAALRRAGIRNFKFHDLRHTFASHFVMRGGSLKELQEILGHKTMTMTLRYAHLSPEHKKKAVNLLNGLTAPAPPADLSQNVTKPIFSLVTDQLSS